MVTTKHFLQAFSRAIGGFSTDKVIYLLLGLRNSGKGMLQELCKAAFSNYITSCETPMAKSMNSGDASEYRFLITTFQHIKRINFTNEAKTVLKQVPVLDGNFLKKCLSGGDPCTARLHHKNEQSIIINTTWFMSFNALPKADPLDAMNVMMPFMTPYQYVDGDVGDDITFRKRDDNLKKRLQQDISLRNAFIKLVFEAYQDRRFAKSDLPPSSLEELKSISQETATEPPAVLLQTFDKDKGGWVSTEQLKCAFAPCKISPKKLGAFLQHRGFERKQNKDRKWGYAGLAFKQKTIEETMWETPEDEDELQM